ERRRERALERTRLDLILAAIADEERRAVGEDAVALDEPELPADERALVELRRGHSPVVVANRVDARVQQALVVRVRLLQMLRGHEEPLGPDRFARVDHRRPASSIRSP